MRKWAHIIFIALFVGALTYMGIRLYNFLQDADMSLGLSRVPGSGIDGMLVNQQKWTPPADSALRPAQIHFALRVATMIDSLDTLKPSRHVWRQMISDLMNDHMATKSAYTWIRTEVYHTLVKPPLTHQDSVNEQLMEMYLPRFLPLQHVYEDSLDAELLTKKK